MKLLIVDQLGENENAVLLRIVHGDRFVIVDWDRESGDVVAKESGALDEPAVSLPPLPSVPPVEQPSDVHRTSRWELAGQWANALTDLHALRKYRRAVRSLAYEGPVSLPVLNHRYSCCHGETLDGVRVSEPCPHRYETDRGIFCAACICPEREKADLRADLDEVTKPLDQRTRYFKLEHPRLACEHGHWSEQDGVLLHSGLNGRD